MHGGQAFQAVIVQYIVLQETESAGVYRAKPEELEVYLADGQRQQRAMPGMLVLPPGRLVVDHRYDAHFFIIGVHLAPDFPVDAALVEMEKPGNELAERRVGGPLRIEGGKDGQRGSSLYGRHALLEVVFQCFETELLWKRGERKIHAAQKEQLAHHAVLGHRIVVLLRQAPDKEIFRFEGIDDDYLI